MMTYNKLIAFMEMRLEKDWMILNILFQTIRNYSQKIVSSNVLKEKNREMGS